MRLLASIGMAAALCVLGVTAVGSHAARKAFPGAVNGRIVFNDQNGRSTSSTPTAPGLSRWRPRTLPMSRSERPGRRTGS